MYWAKPQELSMKNKSIGDAGTKGFWYPVTYKGNILIHADGSPVGKIFALAQQPVDAYGVPFMEELR
jgi:hypothetical protein